MHILEDRGQLEWGVCVLLYGIRQTDINDQYMENFSKNLISNHQLALLVNLILDKK